MHPKQIAILKELQKRKITEETPKFDFYKFAFPKQIEFFKTIGPRFRTAVCSRRAGKTVGVAADLIDTCLSEPNIICLYLTVTHGNVRNIIWRDILKIVKDYKIDCRINNLRMEINFNNGSTISTGGVKDANIIETYRGWKLRKVVLDECQSMRPHVKELINDVLIPALRDLKGNLYLIGTPGPVKAGTFFEYSHNSNWHNFKWTAFDNPFMNNPNAGLDLEDTLREERLLRGINENDPSYLRETYGIWVEDADSLVYKYDSTINNFDERIPPDVFYIMGIDIGFEDSDAIAILGYSRSTNKVYLVEEYETHRQDITSLAEDIKKFRNKYKPVKFVIDAGALGKKIQEELRIRHALPIEAADKQRKLEYIEFLNADLRRGIFKAKVDSLFAQDSKLVTWDRTDKEKPKISNTYHSDITDAVLYAYRECRHYIKENEKSEEVDINSNKFMDELELLESEKMRQQIENPDIYEYEEMIEQEGDFYDNFGD